LTAARVRVELAQVSRRLIPSLAVALAACAEVRPTRSEPEPAARPAAATRVVVAATAHGLGCGASADAASALTVTCDEDESPAPSVDVVVTADGPVTVEVGGDVVAAPGGQGRARIDLMARLGEVDAQHLALDLPVVVRVGEARARGSLTVGPLSALVYTSLAGLGARPARWPGEARPPDEPRGVLLVDAADDLHLTWPAALASPLATVRHVARIDLPERRAICPAATVEVDTTTRVEVYDRWTGARVALADLAGEPIGAPCHPGSIAAGLLVLAYHAEELDALLAPWSPPRRAWPSLDVAAAGLAWLAHPLGLGAPTVGELRAALGGARGAVATLVTFGRHGLMVVAADARLLGVSVQGAEGVRSAEALGLHDPLFAFVGRPWSELFERLGAAGYVTPGPDERPRGPTYRLAFEGATIELEPSLVGPSEAAEVSGLRWRFEHP